MISAIFGRWSEKPIWKIPRTVCATYQRETWKENGLVRRARKRQRGVVFEWAWRREEGGWAVVINKWAGVQGDGGLGKYDWPLEASHSNLEKCANLGFRSQKPRIDAPLYFFDMATLLLLIVSHSGAITHPRILG